ncbi:MAG TPA: ribonuclease P [Candidatus Nanoarchaeia archaeon]|nr:ribonuclease P [Candidatus Nanoarchaeia archaeon]
MAKKSKSQLKDLALKRVKDLFSEAEIIFPKNKELANRYIQIARKTAMKVNLKLPRNLKRKFCKHCYSYLVPGKTSRTRIHKSRVTIYCFTCKKYMRFMIKE